MNARREQKVRRLLKELKRKEPERFQAARNALAAMGIEIVPRLLQEMRRYDEGRYRHAECIAAVIGDIGRSAVPLIIDSFKDDPSDSGNCFYHKTQLLGRYGTEILPELIRALESEEPRKQAAAAFVLYMIGPAAREAIHSLLKIEGPARVLRLVLRALSNMGSAAVPYVSQLIRGLEHPDAQVRMAAADGLIDIGTEAHEAVPALIRALKDEAHWVRYTAACALRAIGSLDARPAIPTLLSILERRKWWGVRFIFPESYHEWEDFRNTVAVTLGSLGATEAVPILLGLLRSGPHELRVNAAHALGLIGAQPQEVILALRKALKHRDQEVRRAAVGALRRFGEDARGVVPDLIKLLRDRDEMVRGSAVRALGFFPQEASQIVPHLVALLEGARSSLLGDALVALVRLSANASEAIPKVQECLDSSDKEVRWCAALTLRALGASAPDILPELEKPWPRGWKSTQCSLPDLLDILAAMPNRPFWTVSFLITLLKKENPSAAENLGELGREAREALPELEEAAGNARYWEVRQAAADAIRRIKGEQR